MKLIRLTGENVRQFKNLGPLYFPQEGLIGVLGLNGAGKSTLMMIIELAIYGGIKGITSGQIKHQGCSTSQKWWVELMFEKDGNFYRVYRHENTTKAVLQVNGNTVQMGQQNVTDYLIQHVLFMDQLSFSTCFYARQDDFDALIKLTDAKRKTEVAKLLRIDSIDKAAKKVRTDRNAYLEQITEAQKHMIDPEVLSEELRGIESDIQNQNQLVKKFDDELQALGNERKALLQKQKEGEALYEQYNQYASEYRQIESNIQTLQENSLNKAAERLSALKKAKEEFEMLLMFRETYQALLEEKTAMQQSQHDFKRKQQLEKEIGTVQNEIASYQKQIRAIDSSLSQSDDLKKQLEAASLLVAQSEEELRVLLEEHQEIKFQLTQKKDDYTKLMNAKKKFEELGENSPCPTCERPLAEHYNERMNGIERELTELLEEANSLKTSLSQTEAKGKAKRQELDAQKNQLGALQQKEQENKRQEDRKGLLSSEWEKRTERLRSLQEEILPLQHVFFDEKAFSELSLKLKEAKDKNDRTFKLESAIEQIPQVEKDIEQDEQTIAIHRQSLERIKMHVQSLNFDVKAYRALSNEIEQKQSVISSKEREKQSVFTDIRVLETRRDHTLKKQEENDEKMKAIADKQKEIVTLGKLDEVLKNYKDDKLSKLAPALSDIMSDLMDTITSGKYDRVELDENYNVNIYRQGVKNPLNFFSGGEQKLAALVQRLAISRLIIAQTGQTGFELIALDEVLGAMDEARQNAIVMTLKSLNYMFKQILMITHSDHVKDMFDVSLEIYQDDKMCSHIRWLDDWDEESVKQLAEEITQLSA